ncbi:MAG: UDP-N-acetylmuramoyl-L-alanyl-D-glutamate--2,6-diaminopimelate ligase, partial [Halanaerobiales bacterium]
MILKKLISEINPQKIIGKTGMEIRNIVYDSRQAEKGSLFVCIEGFKVDGHSFIEQAVNNGAKAVLIEKEIDNYLPEITYVKVADSRTALGYLSAAFYNHPLKNLELIGVTGTNGKTTTTYLIKDMLESAGYGTGLVGTIKNIIGNKTLPAVNTTPKSLDLYRLFDKMVSGGLSHCVMEVSSHALDLKRVVGMCFKVGIFTNISQDHLDFHKSLTEYLKVKSRLFRQLSKDGFAVVNIDDRGSKMIIESSRGEVITYGIKEKADLNAKNIDITSRGVSFDIEGIRNFSINMKLTGLFNVYNTLAAAACGCALNLTTKQIKDALESIEGVAGRFELVDEGQEFSVVVDYAHTPDGMENVLKTALEFVTGKIIVVFGCGGDR